MSDPKTVLALIKEHEIKYVDFRFTDPRGKWQHLAHHVRTISENFLEEGVMFDGSCGAHASLIVFCDVHEPLTGQPYSRDPRSIAKKAERYLVASGIGDTAYFGPEAEFFIFDDVRYSTGMNGAMYAIDSTEGPYVSDREFPD